MRSTALEQPPQPPTKPIIERRRCARRVADRLLTDTHPMFSELGLWADGMLLLDRSLTVISASALAVELLASCGGSLSITRGRLVIRDAHFLTGLAGIMAKGTDARPPVTRPHCFAVRRRQPFQLPLIVKLYAPTTQPGSEDLGRGALTMVLRDPERQPAVQWPLLSAHFGITAAESRLCTALIGGLTVREYCERHNVSIHTARIQLKSVFAKTGTHRQMDLCKLILAFAW